MAGAKLSHLNFDIFKDKLLQNHSAYRALIFAKF